MGDFWIATWYIRLLFRNLDPFQCTMTNVLFVDDMKYLRKCDTPLFMLCDGAGLGRLLSSSALYLPFWG